MITVTDLRERVLQICPKLAQIPFVFAINYKVVSELNANTSDASTVVITYDEIVFITNFHGAKT